MSENTGLASGSLGTIESVIMGIAGTAPAFSVAVTTATIVGAVGTLSVGSVLYCGLIMFGITLAFIHLNKISPNAGATYAWVGQVFGPSWGFFAGWGLLVASAVFMVSATIPAATATLAIVAPGEVSSTTWVPVVAALWLTAVTVVVTRGIKHASYAQVVFTIIETVILVALVVGAVIQYGGKPVHMPSFEWISPFAFTPQLFAVGALSGIFFYWGWDVTMNLGEETTGGEPHPSGKGAFWSMINLMIIFLILMTVVLIVLTDEEIEVASSNVLYAIANKLFPWPWNYLAVISTILSTIGTIETQILQFTRSMFAMARDRMLHPRYSIVHPEWQTPWIATFVIWFFGVVLLFGSTYLPTVKAILDSSVLAIGLQICFYMGLAGLACAWYYRGKLKEGFGAAVSYVLWPLFSALFMAFVAIYSIPTFDTVTVIIGVGGLLIGFIPLIANRMREKAIGGAA